MGTPILCTWPLRGTSLFDLSAKLAKIWVFAEIIFFMIGVQVNINVAMHAGATVLS